MVDPSGYLKPHHSVGHCLFGHPQALRHDPFGPHILYNLRFCLLPDEPEQALRHFDSAVLPLPSEDEDDVERTLTHTNRVLAMILLGKWRQAIDLARRHRGRHADSSRRPPVWLWDIDSVLHSTRPTLMKCDDISGYVTALLDVATSNYEPPPPLFVGDDYEPPPPLTVIDEDW